MRAWGVVAAISLSLVTACTGSASTSQAPAVRGSSTSSTSSRSSASQDPGTSECGPLLSDAATATTRILSYDYRDLPAGLAALRAVTTPAEYARESDERTRVVDPLVIKHRAVMTATPLATGYIDGGCTRPRVLAFARTSSTNAADPTATTTAVQLLLTLTPVAGHYLVDAAGTPSGNDAAGLGPPDCPTAAPAAGLIASCWRPTTTGCSTRSCPPSPPI